MLGIRVKVSRSMLAHRWCVSINWGKGWALVESFPTWEGAITYATEGDR